MCPLTTSYTVVFFHELLQHTWISRQKVLFVPATTNRHACALTITALSVLTLPVDKPVPKLSFGWWGVSNRHIATPVLFYLWHLSKWHLGTQTVNDLYQSNTQVSKFYGCLWRVLNWHLGTKIFSLCTACVKFICRYPNILVIYYVYQNDI